MNNNGRLIITDGTAANTVSMLVGLPGTMLQDWYPKSPQPLSSIWASSPYQDGKQLVNKTYNNIADLFTISISAETQDADIHNLRRFIVLLEKAVLYWTDEFNTQKYWLEVRGECETNIRYALVVDYNIPEITDPFVQPFASNTESVLDSIQIIIEHTIWTDELGVGDSCVEISTGVYSDASETDSFIPDDSLDDCYIGNDGSFTNANGIWVGVTGGISYDCGVRFRNVTIPLNAIIDVAYLRYQARDADVGVPVNVNITIEDNVHPAIFSTYANFVARVMWATQVLWTIPATVVGTIYNTPSITTLIQYIVNEPHWSSGHDIALFLFTHGVFPTLDKRSFEALDGAVATAILVVEWHIAPILHGEAATCLRAPAVQPLWRDRLLTHAFTEDVSLGVFGPNLVETVNEYPLLLPVVVGNGDNLYAGISDLGDPDLASTFNSLVIHLGTRGSGQTLVPEYWDGGGWSPLPNYKEEPDSWASDTATLGIHLAVWGYPDDWEQCVVHGVSGYWMRFNVTAHLANVPPSRAGIPAVPFYPIYTISWPHIQISGNELQGDIGALINFLLATSCSEVDRILISARKYSRTNAGKFVAFIPFNTHVVIPDALYVPDAVCNEISNSMGYTGWIGSYAPFAVLNILVLTVFLGPKTYAGRYRAFIRVMSFAGTLAGNIGYRLRITTDNGLYFTPEVFTQIDEDFIEVVDLGLIDFPPDPLEENVGTAYIHKVDLYVNNLDAGDRTYLFDMILMPVDEAHVEIALEGTWAQVCNSFELPWKIVTNNYKLGAYGYALINQGTPAPMTVNWDLEIWKLLKANILGAFELEPEEDYWLIFFAYLSLPGAHPFIPNIFQYLIAPSLDKNQRFLLARGDE